VTLVVVTVAVVVAAASYLTWTAGRLDRLHARVEGARAALDAQLVRRSSAARALAAAARERCRADAGLEALHAAAQAALDAADAGREAAENDLSRALRTTLPQLPAPGTDADLDRLTGELATATTRVGLARVFHNEAVRDTRRLRGRRIPRYFRLAGRAPLPDYFEIDDAPLPAAPR
jgi:hypothetical protein